MVGEGDKKYRNESRRGDGFKTWDTDAKMTYQNKRMYLETSIKSDRSEILPV